MLSFWAVLRWHQDLSHRCSLLSPILGGNGEHLDKKKKKDDDSVTEWKVKTMLWALEVGVNPWHEAGPRGVSLMQEGLRLLWKKGHVLQPAWQMLPGTAAIALLPQRPTPSELPQSTQTAVGKMHRPLTEEKFYQAFLGSSM